jgi:hypothetical protein
MKSILILASLFLSAASFAASSCTPATGHFGYNSATVVGNKVSVSVPMLYLENGEKAALILNQGLTTVQNGTAICLALGFKHGSVNDMAEASLSQRRWYLSRCLLGTSRLLISFRIDLRKIILKLDLYLLPSWLW